MATTDISAHGTEPQPVPKQEVMDDSQSHLDESKLKQFFIGSIDQGTTSTRFIIFDGIGEPVAQHQIEFNQKYPQSGLVFFCERMRRAFLTSPDGMNTTRKRLSIL
jgi:glycerol kinase